MTNHVSDAAIKLARQLDRILQRKDEHALRSLINKEDVHLVAEAINRLPRGKRKTFSRLEPERQAVIALSLTMGSKKRILPRLDVPMLARFLHFNDFNDAADILQSLDEAKRMHVLEKLPPDRRDKLEQLLAYSPQTAGGLMDVDFIAVQSEDSVQEVIQKVRSQREQRRKVAAVVVVDEERHLLGIAPLRELIGAAPSLPVRKITRPMPTVPSGMDQEELIRFLQQNHYDSAAVVDERQTILGIVYARDLLEAIQTEATEDLYWFAGVLEEENALDPPSTAVRLRSRWLIVNIATAFLAASIVSLFQDTISKFVLLAAYMPIIAGMGGNAGTQTLAVVVRGIALGEVTGENAKRVLGKEIATGLTNGIIAGLIVGIVAFLWNQNPLLGVVLFLAMVTNLFIATCFGTIIPLTLRRMQIDPARSASIFITASTDICGFFTFLGLAELLLV